MYHVVVAGGTGLVGAELIRHLKERTDVRVTALVRRLSGLSCPPVVTEVIFDFARNDSYTAIGSEAMPCDILLCAIGTTLRQAGSQAGMALANDIHINTSPSNNLYTS